MWWWWVGCRDEDPVELDGAILGDEVVCEDPGARAGAPFDIVEDGDWALRPINGGAWGLAAADLDEDGWVDLFVPAGEVSSLFLGGPRGLRDVSERLPPTFPGNARNATIADVDGDGDLDLYRQGPGGADGILLHDGALGFTLRSVLPDDFAMGSAWGDVDVDGDLDLAVSNARSNGTVLYLNDGAGNLTVRDDLLPEGFNQGSTMVASIVDLDQDGLPDLYRANDAGPGGPPNLAAWNVGDRWVGDPGTAGLNVDVCSMGLGIGDLNGDQLPDLALSDCLDLHLLQSSRGVWVEHADARGFSIRPKEVPWGVELQDLDNDGDLDAYVAYGHLGNAKWENLDPEQDGVYLQQDDGSFVERGSQWGIEYGHSRGFVLADVNNDGWLDVVKQTLEEQAVYYRSRCGRESWLRVRLDRAGPNRYGVGARIVATDGASTWTRWIFAGGTSVSSGAAPEAHFGLGSARSVDVEVTWPDGAVDRWEGVPTRRQVTLLRGD